MGQEDESSILPREIEHPVQSVGFSLSRFYETVGLVTREMRVPNSDEGSQSIRSPHTRLQRGLEYQRIQFLRTLNKIPRKLGISDSIDIASSDREHLRQLDDFDRQFQEIHEIDIDTEDSGHQPITYSEVKLENRKNIESDREKTDQKEEDETVTFIIPAWSGEIHGEEPLARAIAEGGDRIITFNYPESHLSVPTEEFAQKMRESVKPDEPVNFNPHTAVFKEAIKQLAKGRKIKIVAYSTGCPITAEMLQDPVFAENVELAVLLSPVAAVNQSRNSLRLGFLSELGSPFGTLPKGLVSPKELLRKSVDTGLVLGPGKKREPEVQAREDEIRDLLEAKDCRKSDKFETARVRKGGKIIVQTGSFDDATKSRSVFAFQKMDNPQLIWMDFLQYSHISPLLHAKDLWRHVNDIAKTPQAKKKYTYAFT